MIFHFPLSCGLSSLVIHIFSGILREAINHGKHLEIAITLCVTTKHRSFHYMALRHRTALSVGVYQLFWHKTIKIVMTSHMSMKKYNEKKDSRQIYKKKKKSGLLHSVLCKVPTICKIWDNRNEFFINV